MKTKYRIINNGYWDILQYEAEVTNLFWRLLGYTKEWRYIPRPYYDKLYGRTDIAGTGANTLVNSLRQSLNDFVEQYPYIDEYFSVFNEEQKELEEQVAFDIENRETRKSKIRYFD